MGALAEPVHLRPERRSRSAQRAHGSERVHSTSTVAGTDITPRATGGVRQFNKLPGRTSILMNVDGHRPTEAGGLYSTIEHLIVRVVARGRHDLVGIRAAGGRQTQAGT